MITANGKVYLIKFVSTLGQLFFFSPVLLFPPSIKHTAMIIRKLKHVTEVMSVYQMAMYRTWHISSILFLHFQNYFLESITYIVHV